MSVWIEHPDLPGQPVEVPELAVPHYRAAGWVVTEPSAKPKKLREPVEETAAPEVESSEESADEAAPAESPKRRRTSTKEQD